MQSMARILAAIGLLFLAGACAGRGDGRPPGETITLPPEAVRLGFGLPAFAAAAGQHTQYRSADRQFREEFAEWRLDDGATASLTLSAANAGKPVSDPVQPAEVMAIWPKFNDKRPSFGDVATARTRLGALSYQRVAVGTSACVIFLRRWPVPDPRVAAGAQANLSGFYCNPPGVLLTPDAAITVLRAVVLRPPRKQS
jgi:hypothetical protein